MGILEKFDDIEIKTDQRISESDLIFCETQQQAYDEARSALAELKERWTVAIKIQREILGASSSDDKAPMTYIGGYERITIADIEEEMEDIHRVFLHKLVDYFNSTYKVSVSRVQIEDALLPQRPVRKYGDWDEAEDAAYHKSLQTLSLQYEDLVDQIHIQLDGRPFTERALDELKQKCHEAAWYIYDQSPKYEVKSDTIRFLNYACTYKDYSYHPCWELSDGTKSILRGVAHFETGSHRFFPRGFPELLSWNGLECSTVEFPTCEKIKQLRMFKNGRVDLKFTSAQMAGQFAEGYLGLVC